MMPLRDAMLLLVAIDGDRPDSMLLEALLERTEAGDTRMLDFIIVSRRTLRRGTLREIDRDEFVLAGIALGAPGLIGVDDAAALSSRIRIGSSAAIILSEHRTGAAAGRCFDALRPQLIGAWRVPASVANTVIDAAQRRTSSPFPRTRRGCTMRPRRPLGAARR